MRELVLDTETTGLDFDNGDKIVEIGVVELENHIQTGNTFHYYLNPGRNSSAEALKVHGLTTEFLSDKPKFEEIVEEFIDYLSDSKIIIHNASFDIGFINSQLKSCNLPEINEKRVIDTIVLAKNKYRGQSVSLDSLCRKYNIDITDREIHGALKDAKLLSLVYLELIGGKQTRLKFQEDNSTELDQIHSLTPDLDEYYKNKELIKKRDFQKNLDDNRLHINNMEKIPNKLWDIFNT
tara:strand:- start:1585 stop:2295 length:711 start_codon:yes stop_codon:yes gene_type:complete